MNKLLTSIFLCLMAMGAMAQTIGIYPRVEQLFLELDSLGMGIRTQITNYDDLKETLTARGFVYIEADTTTCDEWWKRHFREEEARTAPVIPLIRKALQDLYDEGVVQKMTADRKKVGLADSGQVVVVLNDLENDEVDENNPEYLRIVLHPSPATYQLSSGESATRTLNYVQVEYVRRQAVRDTIRAKEQINIKQFRKLLKSVLNQKNVRKRSLKVRFDSTFDYRAGNGYVFSSRTWPEKPKNVTDITIYSVSTKEEVQQLVYALTHKLQQEYLPHPTRPNMIGWSFIPRVPVQLEPKNFDAYGDDLFRCQIKTGPESRHEILIQVRCNTERPLNYATEEREFCILVFESDQDILLPRNWDLLKNWNNGNPVWRKGKKPAE